MRYWREKSCAKFSNIYKSIVHLVGEGIGYDESILCLIDGFHNRIPFEEENVSDKSFVFTTFYFDPFYLSSMFQLCMSSINF